MRELAPALGVKRYAQVHTVTSAFSEAMRRHRGAPEDFDGVAELWWDTVEDFARAGATPEGRAAGRRLLEDEKRFIDLPRSPIWFGEEHRSYPAVPAFLGGSSWAAVPGRQFLGGNSRRIPGT